MKIVLSYAAGFYGKTFEEFAGIAKSLGFSRIQLIPDQDPNLYSVEGIFLGGADILWMEEDDSDNDAGSPSYKTLGVADFETRLSTEMIVPPHLLKITYDFDKNTKSKLRFPLFGTTRKR